MDTERLIEAVPHYLAIFILVGLVLGVIRVTVGSLAFWTELAIVVGVVVGYQFVVTRLGLGPSAWERR